MRRLALSTCTTPAVQRALGRRLLPPRPPGAGGGYCSSSNGPRRPLSTSGGPSSAPPSTPPTPTPPAPSQGSAGSGSGAGGGAGAGGGSASAGATAAGPRPVPPPKGPKVPVTWTSLGLMAVTGAGLAYYYTLEKERKQQEALGKVTTYGKPALGGPWTLVDFNGRPVTDKDFQGEFLLLYFGFTHCPDICPAELVKVGKILDTLDRERGMPPVRPVFISVDPDRDNVAQLRHYAQDFHPRILYLTGTREQLAKVTKAYRVYFSKADEEDEENYLVDHSIVLYLIGPDGSFLDFFTQSMQPPDIVQRIKRYLGQATRVTK